MTKKTAVVVDDEEDLSTYLSTILEENGFEVRTANEAVSGEALVRERRPDIVLLDLMMPGRSGVQLFAKLRRDEATRTIPVVMVTGIREQMGVDWAEVVDNLKIRKPDGFVEKPIDPDKLMTVVNNVLSGKARSGEVLQG
jgi:two-component system phosphate regulon response regulator PhoB